MNEAQKLPFEIVRARRAGARLAAVQALYQMEQTERGAGAVMREFMEDRLGFGPEGEPVEEADPDLFKAIVEGVIARQDMVDAAILARLAKGWRLSRLDATSRAILRAGAAEFLMHPELSGPIIIDEYVSLAHDFFEDGQEAKFINAVLEKVGADLRG
ncbi:MAG: transcription antitermination factor NusB [Alphaproteobacteria bacterium]|jgi:N utilization substance protein B|nr:transcription antitermination factor NusB [Alphaproteobacteria bacterium]